MLNAGVSGVFGRTAAQSFKQVPPDRRHETEIQYTPDFKFPAVVDDLFAYNRRFDENRDGFFNAREIQDASGLKLDYLARSEDIEHLWDLDRDGKVNEREMFVGMAHLDYADGEADGRITEKGRTHLETTYLAPFNPQHHQSAPVDLMETPLFKLDPQSLHEVLDVIKQDREETPEVLLGVLRQYVKLEDKPVQDIDTLLAAHEQGNPLLEGFPDSLWEYADAVSHQPPGQHLNPPAARWVQGQVEQTGAAYQEQLQEVKNALEVEDSYRTAFNAPSSTATARARLGVSG